MGEAKRKRENELPSDRVAREISRKLADDGQIIGAGWAMHRSMFVPKDATEAQVADLRKAFLCGAQNLWACIMQSLDPGSEPTAADERRMALIDAEMTAFHAEMARDHYPTKGSA